MIKQNRLRVKPTDKGLQQFSVKMAKLKKINMQRYSLTGNNYN